jgi:hypothetical protein
MELESYLRDAPFPTVPILFPLVSSITSSWVTHLLSDDFLFNFASLFAYSIDINLRK